MGVNATQGTLLKLSISSVFTTVGQRVRVKPAELTRAKIETTDLDSTWETSIAGIPRAGEIELEINYDAAAATHAALWSSFGLGTVESWKLILADTGAAEYAFTGYITSFMPSEAVTDGLQKAMLKIQISGAVVLTP